VSTIVDLSFLVLDRGVLRIDVMPRAPARALLESMIPFSYGAGLAHRGVGELVLPGHVGDDGDVRISIVIRR